MLCAVSTSVGRLGLLVVSLLEMASTNVSWYTWLLDVLVMSALGRVDLDRAAADADGAIEDVQLGKSCPAAAAASATARSPMKGYGRVALHFHGNCYTVALCVRVGCCYHHRPTVAFAAGRPLVICSTVDGVGGVKWCKSCQCLLNYAAFAEVTGLAGRLIFLALTIGQCCTCENCSLGDP